jgi:uncharacterized protein YjbI with pentapeptide repeats
MKFKGTPLKMMSQQTSNNLENAMSVTRLSTSFVTAQKGKSTIKKGKQQGECRKNPTKMSIYVSVANVVGFSSVQFSSVQFSSVQFSSVQFSSVQFSSVQFSSGECSILCASVASPEIILPTKVSFTTLNLDGKPNPSLSHAEASNI